MWVFRNDSFVSAVEDRLDRDRLWVRGRVKGDVERFFGWPEGSKRVSTSPEADYLFRARVDREEFTEALIEAVDGITYDNFKGSIPKDKVGNLRHDAYMRVWTAVVALQKKLKPKSHYWFKGVKWR